MILSLCPNPAIDILAEIDQFQAKSVNRFKKELRYPGGKGVHVAMAVAEIAGDSALLGVWGGPSGAWVKEECRKKGVNCFGPEVSGWTRSCYTFQSGNAHINETEITGAGPEISKAEYDQFIDAFTAALDKADVTCISGSLAPGFPVETYFNLLGIAKGRKVIIDCSGSTLEKALEQNPYGVHINFHEGKALFNTDDPRSIADRLRQHCTYAAVTNGADGLYLGYEGKVIHARTKVDKVISSVGSGDCLTAGLTVAISRNYSLEETAKLAVACGAANCLCEDLGMLRSADVEALVKKVEIKMLN